MNTTYFAETLFDGHQIHKNMLMRAENGVITALLPASQSNGQVDVRLSGLVTAGFIDTQVNGGGGVLFNHEQSCAALTKMMDGHAKFGTTAMLPTLITDNSRKMSLAADAVAQAIDQQAPGIVGIHFEGPHLSLAKKGIHPTEQVRPISDVELTTVTRQDIGKVMLTVAPETVPHDVIADLVAQGVVISLGHSNADIDTVLRAVDAGAHCFTHLFNAMSGLTAREPGMIGAALGAPKACAGIIVDLEHVHAHNCKLAYSCMGPKRLMLVTDAMAHVGSDLQTLPWLNSTITQVGNKLTLDDGSLAGSCLDMASAVRNMFRILSNEPNTLENVLNMASQTPAAVLGLHNKGQLKTGHNADFVLLNENLHVKASWINGKQIAGTPTD